MTGNLDLVNIPTFSSLSLHYIPGPPRPFRPPSHFIIFPDPKTFSAGAQDGFGANEARSERQAFIGARRRRRCACLLTCKLEHLTLATFGQGLRAGRLGLTHA